MAAVPMEISNFFLAMQAGKPGAPMLESFFAENAVYEEPFTGETRRHEGRTAIMQAMAMGWEMPMVDTHISIDRVETKPGELLIDWTCRSPSLPGGQGCGRNSFVLKDGLIEKLVTVLT